MRIKIAVDELEHLIKLDSNMGSDSDAMIKIEDTSNIWKIDSAIIDLYAESAVCAKLAKEYYPDDDEVKWKPMVDRFMEVLWTAHQYIQKNCTQLGENTHEEIDSGDSWSDCRWFTHE